MEELVYVRDEDMPSNLKKIILVVFNVISFPIYKPLKPELYVIQRKNSIPCKYNRNGFHGIRELVKNFKVEIPVP